MIVFQRILILKIVAILVGAVWGLWIGFGIVAAGTFLGEVSYGWLSLQLDTDHWHVIGWQLLHFQVLV